MAERQTGGVPTTNPFGPPAPRPARNGPVFPWEIDTTYGPGVLVVHDEVVYFSTEENTAIEPGTDPDVWKMIGPDGSGAVFSVNSLTGDVVLGFADVGAASAAQGERADTAVQPGDLPSLAPVATSGSYDDLTDQPVIPSTPGEIGAATAAQGALADSAVQPGDLPDLAPVATSGAYSDLTGTPTIPSTPGDIGAATAAQGALADSAVQPSDLAPVATSGSYDDLSDTPIFAAVATSGQYGDLLNRPAIPSTPGDVGAAPAVHTHAQGQVDGLTAALAEKAEDSEVVHLTGDEAITGSKTFSAPSSSAVPVTIQLAAGQSVDALTVLNSAGNPTARIDSNGNLRAPYILVVNDPNNDTDATNKRYVDAEIAARHQDTGWRLVTSDEAWMEALSNPDAGWGLGGSPRLRVRRLGDEVHVIHVFDKSQSGGIPALAPLPLGWRGIPGYAYQGLASASDISVRRIWYDGGTSHAQIQGAVGAAAYTHDMRFTTNDPWPTTLPGIPG